MTQAARKGSCLRSFLGALLFLFPTVHLHAVAALKPQERAQGERPVIESIQFIGNRRIARDTLQARIFSRQGDPYSEEALRRDFQALWNTQYFGDISLEVEDGRKNPNDKVIIFRVTERPIIRRINYVGIKSVSESDILDRFKERKVGLSVESQFDPTKIKRAEVVLKELLAEHGRQFAVVKPNYSRIAASNAVVLNFNIDEGPKVKVGDIKIAGNHAFSQRRIVRSMRHSRPYGIPLYITFIPVMSKTFDKHMLAEDLEIGVRGLYQDHGYFKVLVKDPILKTVDLNRGGVPGPWPVVGQKHGKRTDITIPIEEGDRYHMGKLVVRSADPEKGLFFKTEFLAQQFPLRSGEIFATDKVRKALDNYRKLYGAWGFIDFTSTPLTDVDETKKTIDLTLEFDQQKQYYVRRIEFVGNHTTRDKVIRRELLISEGDLFNSHLWELSLLRLNQLDYFNPIKPEENVEMKRNVKEGTVDLTLKVTEKGRQSIGLTGGISGLAGGFVGLSYQTNNFLGLGETLTFSAQVGDRQKSFLFGFTEPYIFDRPISTGFTVFANRFNFNQAREASILVGQPIALNPALAQNYNQDQKGGTVFASYPLRRFSFTRVGMTYSYTISDITAFSQASQVLFQNIKFRSFAGPSALTGITSSKILPSITYNTVNSPVNPTGGKSFFVALGFEGGPLQGNVNTVAPTFEAKYFRSVNKKRNVIGVRALGAFATGYGGEVLPPFNRFYIGGEDSVRGFDFFTISPWAFVPTEQTTAITFTDPSKIGPNGRPIPQILPITLLHYIGTRPGGDTQLVTNLEYRIPIAGPVEMDFFFDAGLDGILRKGQLQQSADSLATLQHDFPNHLSPDVQIQSQLSLAKGTNFRLRSSTGIQFVVQLPVVHAPFRFYYAYNLNRLGATIVEPRGGVVDSPALQRLENTPGLDQIFKFQVMPTINQLLATQPQHFPGPLFEPLRTFRFTVSRTF